MFSWIVSATVILISVFSPYWDTSGARSISEHDLVLSKEKIQIGYKTYTITATERIGLYGARHQRYINNNWYWGEFGYGALSGKRSGYLEGGILFGGQSPISVWQCIPEWNLLVGAGGGGSAPQGGGFIVHSSIMLPIPIYSTINIVPEIGYIHFLNGEISSLTYNLSTTLEFDTIEVKP